MKLAQLSSVVLLSAAALEALADPAVSSPERQRKTCVIKASGTNATDDGPAIREAFENCGQHSRVVFEATTYYVNSILDIRGLEDVDIDIYGKLLWSTDIQYWLNHSLPVGYQNQSTAFILGGNNLRIDGHNTGTFDGNGDYWYSFISKQSVHSNFPGRPHALTLNGLTNSVVTGLNFLRSQMWTLSMIYCHHVELNDIFVNNTGNSVQSSNTDGADSIRSSFIQFDNWTVYNGDDSISLKGNSTDISITNSHFYRGLGIALGSIGQYKGEFETLERLYVDNIFFENTDHAVYFKTWTGDQNGFPPNGGGGGLGFCAKGTDHSRPSPPSLRSGGPPNRAAQIGTLKPRSRGSLWRAPLALTPRHEVVLAFGSLCSVPAPSSAGVLSPPTALRASIVAFSQCTTFSGAPANCTNSPFQIRDITVTGIQGTSNSPRVASLQCSAVAPCDNIALSEIDITLSNGTQISQYLCGNVENPRGFNCTGPVCVGPSAAGEC
ncbi:alpha-L-rhamnosidase rgxB [Favolaschia claudopus]|uniref:Alpha-L-rhamnosidase rgxB n=1 Tax=Favolaschia claudopus TaxID=2862362 RepID=A0AAW0AZW1_9AGAR